MARYCFSIFIFITCCCCCHADDTGGGHIQWVTNYEAAVNQCKETNKPLVLFFTGSDWCGWCNKLEDEALDTAAFYQEAGQKFVFVKLDFPLYSNLEPGVTAQNKELQSKYEVRSFPTLILLDSVQQPIGMTGYRPGGGKDYAAHLLKMLQDYSAYRNKMSRLNHQTMSGDDLKHLYDKARELGNYNDANEIVRIGMESEHEQYFLTERYRFLAEEGQVHDSEAVALKQQLLTTDPNNSHHTHYELAVIDFEAYCDEMEKEGYSADLAVEPLISYINKFGLKDRENLWRLQMIVSQVYLDQNDLGKALKYAKASHHSAPSCIQPEIAMAIKSIQGEIHKVH